MRVRTVGDLMSRRQNRRVDQGLVWESQQILEDCSVCLRCRSHDLNDSPSSALTATGIQESITDEEDRTDQSHLVSSPLLWLTTFTPGTLFQELSPNMD